MVYVKYRKMNKEDLIKKEVEKHNKKADKIIEIALREDKRERGLLKPKGYYKNKRIEKQLQEVHIPTMLDIAKSLEVTQKV